MTAHTVIVLGGNSKGNIAWVDSMGKQLKPHFSVITHEYAHWKSGDTDIDFEFELTQLKQFIKYNSLEEYSIVAKSAGLLLSLIGVQRKILTPVSVVGFGLPLEYATHREIATEMLMSTTTRMLLVQGDKDPQGSAGKVRQIISKDILLIQVRSDNHAYDRFKKLSQYARLFIEIHQPVKYRNIPETYGKSLKDVLPNVFASQHQYKFLSNWLYDPHGRIRCFTYGTKSYVAKSTLPSKATKESDTSREARKRLSGVSIGNRSLKVSVPRLFDPSPSETSYLVSEYHGVTCNEQFYLSHKPYDMLSKDEIKFLAEVLAEKGITYPGFLPRNTIVTRDSIYLIDWEDATFNQGPVLLDEAIKTNYSIGWSCVKDTSHALSESDIFRQNSGSSSAEEYEKIFSEMIGAKQVSDNVKSQSYALATLGESYDKEVDNASGRLKCDDIVCAVSPFIPIEVEVFIDVLLAREKKLHADALHCKLSNCVRQAIISNYMMKITTDGSIRALIKSLRGILKEYLEANDISVREAICDLYEDANPNKQFLAKVQRFL